MATCMSNNNEAPTTIEEATAEVQRIRDKIYREVAASTEGVVLDHLQDLLLGEVTTAGDTLTDEFLCSLWESVQDTLKQKNTDPYGGIHDPLRRASDPFLRTSNLFASRAAYLRGLMSEVLGSYGIEWTDPVVEFPHIPEYKEACITLHNLEAKRLAERRADVQARWNKLRASRLP